MSHSVPGTKAPALTLNLAGGGSFDLAQQSPENFTLLVFYRGLHCPICKNQLKNLQDQLDAFRKRGVEPLALSMDSEERATKSKDEWDVGKLKIAYGMSEEKAREFGLFISNAISDSEPAIFSEPGMFLIRKDGTVYFESIQSMPFARPAFDDVLDAIDFIHDKDYPPRGDKAA